MNEQIEKQFIKKKNRREGKISKGPQEKVELVFYLIVTQNDQIICQQAGTYNRRPFITSLEFQLNMILRWFFCLLCKLLNWTFIEKTKGVKQSFIIESEQKSFAVQSLKRG